MSLYDYLFGGLIRVAYSAKSEPVENTVDVKGAVKKTLKQATNAAKKEIRTGVRQRYTYKGAIPIRSRVSGTRATITVKGKRSPLKKFQVRGGMARRRGRHVTGEKLYAQVVRGQGGIIERGFRKKSGQYWRRATKARLPIHMLYGPAAAQMAGHEPMPVRYVDKAIEEAIGNALGANL